MKKILFLNMLAFIGVYASDTVEHQIIEKSLSEFDARIKKIEEYLDDHEKLLEEMIKRLTDTDLVTLSNAKNLEKLTETFMDFLQKSQRTK